MCLCLCYSSRSPPGDPFHEPLVCRFTAFNCSNNISVPLWNIMMKRLAGRTEDYCRWITQKEWMHCTSEVKWETSLWTEDGLNILMNLWTSVLWWENFNLFGCLLQQLCQTYLHAKEQRKRHKGPKSDPDASVFQKIDTEDGCRGWQEMF